MDLWHSQKITDYDFVIQRFRDPNYSHIPFLIKVRKGDPVYVNPVRENAGLELTDGYDDVSSVEKMFDLIKKRCESGEKVEVEYEKTFGYPRTIRITLRGTGVHNVDSYVIEKFSETKSE